jgi:hypothetical protein
VAFVLSWPAFGLQIRRTVTYFVAGIERIAQCCANGTRSDCCTGKASLPWIFRVTQHVN